MSTNRSKDRWIATLVVLCVLLFATTTWALLTRGSAGGESGSGTAEQTFWVAPDGDDAASGSRDDPWATLQHGVDQATPGTTIYVRGGSYEQLVSFPNSGEPGRPITLAAEPGEQPVLDASELDVPAGQSGVMEIDGQHDIAVEGLEITGYRSDVSGEVPIGVLVIGESGSIRLADLKIHDLGTTYDGRNGGDAHGIGVFGTSAAQPISGVQIVDNELSDLTLGSSEALVLNGNVTNFLVEGNQVHDTNNIGIDVIGFEGTAPDPTVDQARDGIIRGNQIWNVDSRGNPAYGNSRSADGIYIDGGRDVLVEQNVIHDVNIGIELASEHADRATRNVIARNNLVYDATTIGIAIGGYDRRRGSTESCTIVNNTVVRPDGPALLVQFDTRDNVITNNILVAGSGHSFVENPYRENVDNVVDYNLYWADDGSSSGTWQWKQRDHEDFNRWQAQSGIDEHSQFADPRFTDQGSGDYTLRSNSPAFDAGLRLLVAGTEDLAGEPRSQGVAIDIGSYELSVPAPSPTPAISGTRVYVSDLKWRSEANGWGPVEVDQSNGERARDDGLPLTVGSSTFDHGLGVHAPSRILVELPPDCSMFYTDVGLDEEVGSQGTVVFEVHGDGKLLASSGLVFATDEAMPLSADVTGVKLLALVVTDGDDTNAFDHADWGDARLDCTE